MTNGSSGAGSNLLLSLRQKNRALEEENERLVSKVIQLTDEINNLQAKLVWSQIYRPNGRCRTCGQPGGKHTMACANYIGPLEHVWDYTQENPTFSGTDYYCRCGGWFRQGGLAGHGDGSITAKPICPNLRHDWRGERPTT